MGFPCRIQQFVLKTVYPVVGSLLELETISCKKDIFCPLDFPMFHADGPLDPCNLCTPWSWCRQDHCSLGELGLANINSPGGISVFSSWDPVWDALLLHGKCGATTMFIHRVKRCIDSKCVPCTRQGKKGRNSHKLRNWYYWFALF